MSTSKICVAVRKRPVGNDKDVVQCEHASLAVNEPKVKYDLTPYIDKHVFTFDMVLDEAASNRDVYNQCCRALIDTVFNNGHATCFAYGQTGSGKTHTLLGKGDEPGLYVCAARDVFQRADAKGYEIVASFYEIYGRKLFDLLNNRSKLVAREDADKVINICGLSEHVVSSMDTLYNIITRGGAYRSAGQTSANAESSRSHAVLQLDIRDRSTAKTVGKMSFIDLAGNERGMDSFDCDRRTRMEAAEINKSLLALKECIRSLGMGKAHVPFRGSVLTEVLRDSFLGNSRTTMIATISPNAANCEHTLNTLRYTQRVKELGRAPTGKNAEALYMAGPMAKVDPGPLAGRRKRPEWNADFGNEAFESPPAVMSPKKVEPRRGGKPAAAAEAKPARKPSNPRIDILPDKMVETILQNRLHELDESEKIALSEAEDSEPEVHRVPQQVAPKLHKKVKAVHAHIVESIQKSVDDTVVLHRQHIDTMMHLLKDEVAAIPALDEDTIGIDEYVVTVESKLAAQSKEINRMLDYLAKVKGMLKEEEVLSRTLTPAVRQRKPSKVLLRD